MCLNIGCLPGFTKYVKALLLLKKSWSWVCSVLTVFCHRSCLCQADFALWLLNLLCFFSHLRTYAGWSHEGRHTRSVYSPVKRSFTPNSFPTTHCHGVHETLPSPREIGDLCKNEQEKNNNCVVKKCRREGKVALVGKKKEVKQSLETHDEEIVIANTATQTLVTGRSYHKCLSCLSAIKGLHDKKKDIKRIIILISQ